MQASDVAAALADLGSGQWGLVTAPQAHQVGVTRTHLSRLSRSGALVRLSHGIYGLRGAMTQEHAGLRAAWLALDPARPAADRLDDGPGAPVVSYASAAVLQGLGRLDADRHEFTTYDRKQSRRAGLRLHATYLAPDEITVHGGLPVTTPARTIVDLLIDGYDGGRVAEVLADAVRARRLDLAPLAARLAPFAGRFDIPRRDGHALLRHLLELGGVPEEFTAEQLAAAARAARAPVGRPPEPDRPPFAVGGFNRAGGSPRTPSSGKRGARR